MVLVLAAGEGRVQAFPSARDAEAHCKGLDVEDGAWLFFADDGSPLEPCFTRPNRRGAFTVSGVYVLQRALSGRWLQERLDEVNAVDGPGLACVADLVETLKINRGKRANAQGRADRTGRT